MKAALPVVRRRLHAWHSVLEWSRRHADRWDRICRAARQSCRCVWCRAGGNVRAAELEVAAPGCARTAGDSSEAGCPRVAHDGAPDLGRPAGFRIAATSACIPDSGAERDEFASGRCRRGSLCAASSAVAAHPCALRNFQRQHVCRRYGDRKLWSSRPGRGHLPRPRRGRARQRDIEPVRADPWRRTDEGWPCGRASRLDEIPAALRGAQCPRRHPIACDARRTRKPGCSF